MKKILVVYNCCGIARNNISMWSSHLSSILNQNYENFDVCVSGCRISEEAKTYFTNLKNEYKNKIHLSFIDEVLPVNITFNKACIMSSEFENYDAFMYVASDVSFGGDNNVISKLTDLHFSSNYGITSAVVSFDSGIEAWLGSQIFHDYLNNSHYEVPIGKTLNLHCMLFDRKIFDSYNKKILPDIFRTYCTESVFSFITASLGLKFIIHNKSVFLSHLVSQDGASSGFNGYRGWEDMFNPSISAQERLMNEEAKSVGFGYEEYINVFVHDENKYNEKNEHKNPEELYTFNKKAIFLSENEFNYDKININFFSK
jgi:hypothetical protein